MEAVPLLFTAENCSNRTVPSKGATPVELGNLGNVSYGGRVPAPAPAVMDLRPCPRASVGTVHSIHLCRPGCFSPVFAGISNYSFPEVHTEDTHAGREFLLQFKLCKHLKSHFLFDLWAGCHQTRKHH